jgi:cold shock CspA family protein
MQGTMLWFNVEKGYGYIETEQEERLYVARSGFLPDHEPAPRCKGRPVRFDRELVDGEACAVSVSFVMQSDSRRARLRHARGGKSL